MYLLVALENEPLLNMMLSYAALHRASLLDHREPSMRISRWMGSVYLEIDRFLKRRKADPEFQGFSKPTTIATILLYRSYVNRYVREDTTFLLWPEFLPRQLCALHRRFAERTLGWLFLKDWVAHLFAYGDPLISRSVDPCASWNLTGSQLVGEANLRQWIKSIKRALHDVGCCKKSCRYCALLEGAHPGVLWGKMALENGRSRPVTKNQIPSLAIVHQVGRKFGRYITDDHGRNGAIRSILQSRVKHIEIAEEFGLARASSLAMKVYLQSMINVDTEEVEGNKEQLLCCIQSIKLDDKAPLTFPLFIAGATTRRTLVQQFVAEELTGMEQRGILQVRLAY